MNKTRRIIVIGLLITLCGAWALAPLWVNPCIHTRLNEEEVDQTREFPNYRNLTVEQQAMADQLHREAEIPCGAEDLPLREKLRAANWEGRVLSELSFITKPLILRFELVDVGENRGAYYFKGYTFFYIPLYRIFAGGSGYMEIDMLPFEDNALYIGEWK
jgi:hypothetical protein